MTTSKERAAERAARQPLQPMLLRIDEAAEALGMSRSKLYQLLHDRKLPVVHIGKAVRIPREALIEWIARNTTTGL